MTSQSITGDLQPDQRPERWDDHVLVYERVFEPFTLGFAQAAISRLELVPKMGVLDVGAGCGGAALVLANAGMEVTAIDASLQMIKRTADRAQMGGLMINSHVMDGQALTFTDGSFDAAMSVFGIVQ